MENEYVIEVKAPQSLVTDIFRQVEGMGGAVVNFKPLDPLPSAPATRQPAYTRWVGGTRVQLKRYPRNAKHYPNQVLDVAQTLGVGWTGTYDEVYTCIAELYPDHSKHAWRTIRAALKPGLVVVE